MTCAETRLALLDAEPHELTGDADGALSLHLRSCEACRADAGVITAQTAAMRSALAAHVDGHTPVAGGLRRARRIRIRALAPLALAATLAAVLLLGDVLRRPAYDPSSAGLYLPEPAVPDAPVVNEAAGGGVAIMRTTNPDITVVWTF